jgi:hypothetical protein
MIRVMSLAVAAATLVLATGCSDLGPLVKPKPQAQLSALALDFGTVAVSQVASRSLVIHNLGTAPLDVTPSITGAQYTLPAGNTPFSVPPGGQWTLDVNFAPGAVGAFAGTLGLGPDAPQVGLAGTGALQNPGAHVTIAPGSVDFGVVLVGNNAPGAFQITSDGTAAVLIDVVSNAAGVSVTSGGGPATLNPGDVLNVALQFAPLAGGAVTGSVATGPGNPDVPVTGVITTVSFARDVNPILGAGANACSGCHVWGDPNASVSYNSIVNAPSQFYPPHVIIKPGDLANSVLYGKITNSGQYGPSMPQGSPLLPVASRNLIKTWILEGARNN